MSSAQDVNHDDVHLREKGAWRGQRDPLIKVNDAKSSPMPSHRSPPLDYSTYVLPVPSSLATPHQSPGGPRTSTPGPGGLNHPNLAFPGNFHPSLPQLPQPPRYTHTTRGTQTEPVCMCPLLPAERRSRRRAEKEVDVKHVPRQYYLSLLVSVLSLPCCFPFSVPSIVCALRSIRRHRHNPPAARRHCEWGVCLWVSALIGGTTILIFLYVAGVIYLQ